MMRTALALFVILVPLMPARAEHRAALLIGNHAYQDKSLALPAKDLGPLAKRLEMYGIRCKVLANLDEKELKTAIEAFANRTPTCGTALVYFAGQVLPGTYKGKSAVCLLGANSKNGKGYPLDLVLEALTTKGGSRLNLVIADAAKVPDYKTKLPQGCLLAFNDRDRLLQNLTGTGDLIAALRSGRKLTRSTIPSGVTLAGPGSKAISPPGTFVLGNKPGDEWVNGRGTVFCWCPPGRYTKGSPQGESGRYPDETQSEVTVESGFWISKYELTLRENLRNHPRATLAKHKNDPLTMINLDDARQMTRRVLTGSERKAGRLPGSWEYSLPTEEQWEYAARAGTRTAYCFGSDLRLIPQYANFGDKSYYATGEVFSLRGHRTLDDGVVKLARVGRYKPNPWGLHDVHGNVAEWCINGAIRGGSWASTPENCRSAFRHVFSSRNEQNFIGYRLVIQRATPSKKK